MRDFVEVKSFFCSRVFLLYVLVFVLGVVLRFVPELFSSVYPAGCDIPFYVYELKIMEQGLSWDQLYFGNPLVYVVLLALHGVTQLDWFLLMKFFSPFLNGCVAASFLYFLRNGLDLDWKPHEYLLCVVLLLFSSSGIIMSNSLLKQQLALIFLFLFLVAYKRKDFRLELLFAVLVVCSHQLISVVLFGFVAVDLVVRLVRHDGLWIRGLGLLFAVFLSIFVVTFLLPILGSVDPMRELMLHISAYFDNSSYGFRYVAEPIMDRIVYHFMWYYNVWMLFVGLAFVRFFKVRTVNLLLLVLLPFSFLPLGTSWARFQWLLAYPFAIIFVGGTKHVKLPRYDFWKWSFRIFRCLFLVCIVTIGCTRLVDTSWSMPRSSVPFEDIPIIRGNYEFLSPYVTENSLIIEYDVSLSWDKNFYFDDGKDVTILSVRTVSFFVEDDALWLYRGGIKGHDFWIYRTPNMMLCLDDYDNVFVTNVDWFVDMYALKDYWQYFERFGSYDGPSVYRYNGNIN